MTLDYKAIDVDNHYYEPTDSFTRHLPKEFKRRGVQMLTDGKRTFAVMGGVINQFIPNPTFDPIIEPGCLDLLLSGRVFYADEAAELGLVNDVVPPEELLPRAIGYAEDIAANCAPSSLAVIKQQVYADTMRDVFEASDHAEKLMGESMQRPDFIEGITAFFEKRTPNFPPLEEVT